MADFVLPDPRRHLAEGQTEVFALEVVPLHRHRLGPADVLEQVREVEAPLALDHAALRLDDLGVDRDELRLGRVLVRLVKLIKQ